MAEAPETDHTGELGDLAREVAATCRRLVELLNRLPGVLARAQQSAQGAHGRADAFKQMAGQARRALAAEQEARIEAEARVRELEARCDELAGQVQSLRGELKQRRAGQ